MPSNVARSGLWMLLVAGCGDPLAQLEVRVDGTVITDAVELPQARAHTDPSGVEVALHNAGPRPVMGLELGVPEGLRVDGDLPDTLEPGATEGVWLFPEVDTDRVIDGVLVVRGDRGEVEVPVRGVVTPWVQVALQDRPDVAEAVQAHFDEEGMVGLVVGVAVDDTIVYLQGFGLADIEAQIPVDPEVTLFRWASLSKGLTGIVAAQADEAGVWSLDDLVSDWVEGYEVPDARLPSGCSTTACSIPMSAAERRVSVRELLQHTGGMQHYTNGTVIPVPPTALTDDPETNTGIAWALDYWVEAPLVAVPGTAYNYSTFGFNLAGVAVEGALGEPFGAAVLAGVARPLSMHTMAVDKHWEALPNRAVGYRIGGSGVVSDGDNDVSWKAPGGGFVSSGADLARYCAGLQGEVLMSAERRDGVLWGPSAVSRGYGLGFSVGESTVSHTGAQQKSRTAIAWIRPTNTCFAVMTNSTWVDPWEVVQVLDAAWSGSRAAAPLHEDPTPWARD